MWWWWLSLSLPSIEITSRRLVLRSQSRATSLSLRFPSVPSHDFSRPSVRSFRIPECKRARRDRIRITLPAESLIARSEEEDRVLRACHFTVFLPPPSFHPRLVLTRLRVSGAIVRTSTSSSSSAGTVSEERSSSLERSLATNRYEINRLA